MKMSINESSSFPLATELLVATFTPDCAVQNRNDAWQSIFGQTDQIWSGMSEQDQGLAAQFLGDASKGVLVTNRVFFVQVVNKDQPLPVLLHFIPSTFANGHNDREIYVTITGEVLVEPGSWVLNQTQRIRIENVGRMTLGLIHEINNMLTNVLGNIELIETNDLLDNSSKELKNLVQTIRKAALDGASMTKSIKSYIRNEKTSTFEHIDLSDLIQECVAFTRPYWYNEPRREGIEIDLMYEPSSLPPIMGSIVELKEVFINLITNAVQAMPRGGQLRITSETEGNGPILIKIADNGNGMSDMVKRRIFEPMFTTKGKMGTGMGLSICQSILRNHDAAIEVESEIGQGTTFTLTFKQADAPVIKEKSTTPQSEIGPVNILAVDDEPGVRNILANLLKTKGHQVAVASSGYEALDRLHEHQIDIVFTDHGMPEMNGQQLARAIRQINPDLPIVLVTGDTEFDYHLEEIDAIIGKPFFLEELQRVIDDLLVSPEKAF